MRVLFVHPEKYLNYGIPAGISILSAIIKKKGHEADIFDTTFLKSDIKENTLSDDSDAKNASAGDEQSINDVPFGTLNIANKKNGITHDRQKSKTGIFKETEYTMDDLVRDDPVVNISEALQQKIDTFNPEVIALSTMTTTFDFGVNLLRNVKYNAVVIVGGVHPTIATDDCLAQDVIDIACVGEADDTFPELLDLMQKGKDYYHVKGMNFKLKDGSIVRNTVAPRVDLNTLPVPDWDIFDSRHLFRPFDGEIYQGSFYSQARGCPMQCTYCVDPTISEITGGRKNYFRIQDPEVTYEQLKFLKEKYNATWFKFVDDTFLLPKIEHLERLRDLIQPLNIMFGCSVMPNTIKEDKVKLARDMGCVAMSVGVESGNNEIRRSIMRNYKNDQVIERLRMVQSYGIRVSTFNIIGFPGETRSNVFETIELNRRIGTGTANVYILYPYPGSPIAIEHKVPLRNESGQIHEIDIGPELGFSEMSADELKGLRSTFNLYLELPKSLYPIINLAEKQNESGQKILQLLDTLATQMTSGSVIEMESLIDIVSTKSLDFSISPKLKVPKIFSKILNAIKDESEISIAVGALASTYKGEVLTIEKPYEPIRQRVEY